MALTALWEANRTGDPAPRPVRGHHDVVVVGGGRTGLATALELVDAGRSVLVVEARRVGAGTTGRSTAKVTALQGTTLGSIRSRHGDEVARQYAAAQLAGLEWVHQFCEAHDVAVQPREGVSYATTERGAADVEAEHAAAVAAGLATELTDELPLPFPVTRAVRLEGQLQVDPVALVDAMAAEARRRGVAIAEGTRVQRVRSGRPCEVVTETGTATTPVVVLATNLPMLDRGGHFARMQPVRSYSLALDARDHPPLPGMYLSVDGPLRSLRDAVTDQGRHLLVGGEGHTTGREPAPSRRLAALRGWAVEHFPGLAETHAWSAQDFAPGHGLPLAGPLVPDSDRLLFAGGYSKWGFTNGVAAAIVLGRRLAGESPEWADAMQAWSRAELQGLGQVAMHNAEVGLEMARGWLAPVTRMGRTPAEGEGVVRVDRLAPPTAVSRVDDREHAVSAVCTHLGGIVRWNDAEQSWDCPLHGSRFAPDGTVLEGPATCALRQR